MRTFLLLLAVLVLTACSDDSPTQPDTFTVGDLNATYGVSVTPATDDFGTVWSFTSIGTDSIKLNYVATKNGLPMPGSYAFAVRGDSAVAVETFSGMTLILRLDATSTATQIRGSLRRTSPMNDAYTFSGTRR